MLRMHILTFPHAKPHAKLGYLACNMQWAIPQHSKREVNRAGETLADPYASPEALAIAYVVVNNWRASHNFPLNTFQTRLRRVAIEIDPNSLVVQRIKRLASITSKLERIRGLNLAQIQDIGGCRAIVNNVHAVEELVAKYTKGSRGVKHILASTDDYIQNPKADGYRCVHLVYKYQSDKNPTYLNHKVEVQIRTVLQHAWATAVETVDTFTGQALKSGIGKDEWKRFFVVISSAIAIKEKTPLVPNADATYKELRAEIIYLERKLKVISSLAAFATTLNHIETFTYGKGAYFLLSLDTYTKQIEITPFKPQDSTKATKEYLEAERTSFGRKNVVLVSANSLDALKLAYPNYYADTSRFIGILNEFITGTVQYSLLDDPNFFT